MQNVYRTPPRQMLLNIGKFRDPRFDHDLAELSYNETALKNIPKLTGFTQVFSCQFIMVFTTSNLWIIKYTWRDEIVIFEVCNIT